MSAEVHSVPPPSTFDRSSGSVGTEQICSLVLALERPGLRVAMRRIEPADEGALCNDEAIALRHALPIVRRQSGAARDLARGLIAKLGGGRPSISRHQSRAPIWPAGFVGSMAHDDRYAVAAVARITNCVSLGIDIEPAVPLAPEIAARIMTSNERRRMGGQASAALRLFVVKEAVYKALNPLDGRFLDFSDIDVDLRAGIASIRGGLVVTFDLVAGSHVVALARVDY